LSRANFAENPSELSKGLDGFLDVHFFLMFTPSILYLLVVSLMMWLTNQFLGQ